MTKMKNPKYNRLSEALRQNLLKRKEQQRNRSKDDEKNRSSEVPEKTESNFVLEDQGEKE